MLKPDATLSIKFISNGCFGGTDSVILNPAYLFLKTYYEIYGKSDIKWLEWDSMMLDSEDVQFERIAAEHPDIVCFAVFVWNQHRQFALAKRLKEKYPEKIMIFGGPQLTAHKDTTFFEKHPYIDYVCYGDGEKAFQLLIDKITGNLTELVNIVENENGTTKINPFEVFYDDEFAKCSPYIIQKDIILKEIDKLVSAGCNRDYLEMGLEYARGCMYSCSFCDWSQNLTKKVKRRKNDWRAELNFFKDIDLKVYSTDANFGQWTEDIDILDYAISIYDPKKIFKFYSVNHPKLKKSALYEIIYKHCFYYDHDWVALPLQDISIDILKNADRPSIPYSEMAALMDKLRVELAAAGKRKPYIYPHILVGIPGQTYDTMSNMFKKLMSDGIRPHDFWINHWAYAENSPASDRFYKALHKLKWIDVYTFMYAMNSPTLRDNEVWSIPIEELYEKIANGRHSAVTSRIKLMASHRTMTFREMIASRLLVERLKDLNGYNDVRLNELDIIVDTAYHVALKESIIYVERHMPLIEKYGFAVFVNDVNGKRTILEK